MPGAGLVQAGRIAVDSPKLAANASGYANKTYGQIVREILADAKATDAAEARTNLTEPS